MSNDQNDLNMYSNTFQLHGKRFSSIYVPQTKTEVGNIWVKAKELTDFFGYGSVEGNQAIRNDISSKGKKRYYELINTVHEEYFVTEVDLDTIFVNISGFANLAGSSELPIPKSIYRWLYSKVTPGMMVDALNKFSK